MAGSTFQPPIHLDPNQDAPQQTAFINQNFQTIAASLESNSFRIVNRGVASVAAPAASTVSWTTVPHNLGFAPMPFAFLTGENITFGASTISSNANIPLPTYIGLGIDTVNHQLLFRSYMDCFADATNLYVVVYNSTGTDLGTFPVQYYLVQQPSS